MKSLKLTALTILLLSGMLCLCAENQMPVIASFHGEHHDSLYGYSMTSLDFNHDGIDDLAVCALTYGYVYGESPARGKVYVYLGGNDFSSTTPASLTLEGDFIGGVGRTIRAVYKVGDINGDGFDDLCVRVEDSVSWSESYAKLLLYYGGTDDLEVPDHVIDMYYCYVAYLRVYPLGDVNGDGYDDMGIYYLHNPPYEVRHSIIYGVTFTEQVISSGEVSESYASCIHGIGDINNDGYADFTSAFATPTTNPTHNLIRLYFGNAECDFDDPITFIYSQQGVSRGSKPLGDMNGDGYDDFMGYATNAGVHVWLGGPAIVLATPDFNLEPRWYGGEYQQALAHGDFNGDGYSDVTGASIGTGLAVWLGKRNVNGTADLIIGNPGHDYYGYSLTTGDFNGDGYDDIAIAAPHEYNSWPDGNYPGYVWVHAGNAELKDTTVANDDPAIPSISDNLVVKLSPNPITLADNVLNIELQSKTPSGSEQVMVEIFNIKGQSFYKETYPAQLGARTHQLPVSSLANGVYLCRVTSGKQHTTSKFCVIK